MGICLDSDVSMRSHVSRSVSVCFGILRQLRSIHRSLSHSVFQSLVAALVLTKLNFGNATQVWYTVVPARSSPGGHECCGSTRVPVQSIRPHHTAASASSLAACARVNNIQTGRTSLPVSPWTCAGLPD